MPTDDKPKTAPTETPIEWAIKVGNDTITLKGVLHQDDNQSRVDYEQEGLTALKAAGVPVLLAVAHLNRLTNACFHQAVETMNRQKVDETFDGAATEAEIPIFSAAAEEPSPPAPGSESPALEPQDAAADVPA